MPYPFEFCNAETRRMAINLDKGGYISTVEREKCENRSAKFPNFGLPLGYNSLGSPGFNIGEIIVWPG
jgi:hypothetical protein